MKPDEARLLAHLQHRKRMLGPGEPLRVRYEVGRLGMNEKRAAYLCEKWTTRGWYDYGVNVLAGWLTDAGMEVVAPIGDLVLQNLERAGYHLPPGETLL